MFLYPLGTKIVYRVVNRGADTPYQANPIRIADNAPLVHYPLLRGGTTPLLLLHPQPGAASHFGFFRPGLLLAGLGIFFCYLNLHHTCGIVALS